MSDAPCGECLTHSDTRLVRGVPIRVCRVCDHLILSRVDLESLAGVSIPRPDPIPRRAGPPTPPSVRAILPSSIPATIQEASSPSDGMGPLPTAHMRAPPITIGPELDRPDTEEAPTVFHRPVAVAWEDEGPSAIGPLTTPTMMHLGVGVTSTAVAFALLAASWWIWTTSRTPAPVPTPNPVVAAAVAPKTPVEPPPEAPSEDPPPVQEEVTPAEDPPAAEPAAEPPPVVESPRSKAQVLIDAGWKSVEADPRRAADHFRRALDLLPASAEASYGLGYALLRSDGPDVARPFLCAARSGEVEIRREVAGLLAQHQLSCN